MSVCCDSLQTQNMASSKKPSATLATRAGLLIPPSRIRNRLKARKVRVSSAAPVFAAAVVESMLQEVILKALELVALSKGNRLTPAAVMAATRDCNASRVFSGLTMVTGHTLDKPGDTILTAEAATKRQERIAASKCSRKAAEGTEEA